MRFIALFSALGATALVTFAACSSFDSGSPDGTADAGLDGAPPPPPAPPPSDGAADAEEAPDANPCRFGNGKFDGSFCDDFDRATPLGALWTDIVVPPEGGVVEIEQDDAAASKPNVFRAALPQHVGLGYPFATATPPLIGAKAIDCTFRVALAAIASDEHVEVFHVTFADGNATRSIGVSVFGSNGASNYVERYQTDGGADMDASTANTHLTFDSSFRRVRVVVRKAQAVTVDIDGISSFVGSVPSDVSITKFLVGIWSTPDGGGAAALYDDFACSFE
jgi:hypothetical protein